MAAMSSPIILIELSYTSIIHDRIIEKETQKG